MVAPALQRGPLLGGVVNGHGRFLALTEGATPDRVRPPARKFVAWCHRTMNWRLKSMPGGGSRPISTHPRPPDVPTGNNSSRRRRKMTFLSSPFGVHYRQQPGLSIGCQRAEQQRPEVINDTCPQHLPLRHHRVHRRRTRGRTWRRWPGVITATREKRHGKMFKLDCPVPLSNVRIAGPGSTKLTKFPKLAKFRVHYRDGDAAGTAAKVELHLSKGIFCQMAA